MTRPLAFGVGALSLFSISIVSLFWSGAESTSEPPPPKAIQWVSFDSAFAQARAQNKKVFMDVYTDWCTWCKKMDKDVYPDAAVIKELSKNFIAVKLNAEGDRPVTFRGEHLTETQFARSAGISGYPTTVFFEPDGKPITLVPGFMPAQKFTQVLSYFSGEHYKSGSFQEFLNRQGLSNAPRE